ncbi:hypothetical protein BT63DRAFT_457302 [Microthyrium microscopicum]|uniref:26S proteasome complex subunit SEM1 n=1 Tax=Microthyrium microscopicum TaxID=703497 RepID=A0A6A6U752_9PEZI|nr:hypothetical protein BT63DRAFT_457302 [Microthyrium microscopicum]
MSAADSKTATKNDAPTTDPTDKKALAAKLEEDDEFEDFPAEDWEVENTDLPSGNTHLWEESWDDDDTNDDFSAQLKEELKKVATEGAKKS